MWAKGGDGAQAALTASQGCVWHQALTLTCGFDAAYPSGTGIIPGPQGLSWELVPPSWAGQCRTQQDNGSKCHIASSSEG